MAMLVHHLDQNQVSKNQFHNCSFKQRMYCIIFYSLLRSLLWYSIRVETMVVGVWFWWFLPTLHAFLCIYHTYINITDSFTRLEVRLRSSVSQHLCKPLRSPGRLSTIWCDEQLSFSSCPLSFREGNKGAVTFSHGWHTNTHIRTPLSPSRTDT